MENEKKSIVKEALADYKNIQEAADANAKKRLAEEFPEKFSNILKEEINKNKSAKESKKLDESEDNKESVMKNLTKETVKVTKTIGDSKPFGEKPKGTVKVEETAGDGKPFDEKPKGAPTVEESAGDGKPFDEKPKGVETVEEDVKIIDTVGKADPYKEKVKGGKVVDETVKITDTVGKGDPFNTKAKKAQKVEENAGSGKPLQTEEFNITELDASSVGSALEGAGQEDEVLTMEQIEEEIASMEGLGEELGSVSAATPPAPQAGTGTGTPDVAMNELVAMRDRLNEIIKGGGVDEMHAAGQETFGSDSQVASLHNQGPTDKLIDEESPITDDDINAVLGGGNEAPVEESLTQTLGNMKKVPSTSIPGVQYKSTGAVNKMRSGLQTETDKKIGVLIEENKKLTKKLNETKEYKKTVTTLVESYKSALDKYRGQLKEMAVFNTNLAHVNNLLVNEELALTQEDKIKIINEFKKVDNIATSQKVYTSILSEMKGSKKTLTESVQDKVSASIQPSSKQKLDEVIEKTAYADDKHINRMKVLIESMEKRGKKKII